MTTLETIQSAQQRGDILESTAQNLENWLGSNALPAWAVSSLEELVEAGNWEELNDRFYKTIAFGTGGMRGRTIMPTITQSEKGNGGPLGAPEHAAVGSALLNDFNIVKATIGLYRYTEQYLREKVGSDEAPSLVIAADVRHFSAHFRSLAASVWTKLGGKASIFEGPRSTPQLSFTVRELKAHVGIVITASHNPPHDNGYKVYFGDGAQVVAPHDSLIIQKVNEVTLKEVCDLLEVDTAGINILGAEADAAYLKVLEENVINAAVIREQAPKIVFTNIHGTGDVASVPVLEHFGCTVISPPEQVEHDGRFPTVKSPNPENAPVLELAVKMADADAAHYVAATDPDADRMGVAVRNDDGDMQLLTGNQIGACIAAYRIAQFQEQGLLLKGGTDRAVLIKTFVTTELQAAIARAAGLKVINTLTGFKFIGAKLKFYEEQMLKATGDTRPYDTIPLDERRKALLEHSTFYVFGGEESYGYLASDRVRDKDANAAVLMFAELAAYLQQQGKTFTTYLDEIYLQHGYFQEGLINIVYEGASGAQKIKNILDSYRSDAPKQIGEYNVISFTDFGTQEIKDADGHIIPPQNFYVLELDNGYRYAVRGSGTEPKIKFYVFAREDVSEPSLLAEVKAETAETVEAVKAAIEADARARAEG